MKSRTSNLVTVLFISTVVSIAPIAGGDEIEVSEVFSKFVESVPSDEAGLPGEPSRERDELFAKLVALEPTTSQVLLQIIEGDSSANVKGQAIIFLRDSGIGVPEVIESIRRFVNLEQESRSKRLLSLSISYLEKHGSEQDLAMLEDLANRSSGSLSYFSNNAKENLRRRLSEVGVRAGELSENFEADKSPAPGEQRAPPVKSNYEGRLDLVIAPSWPFVVGAIAVLGILLMLLRAFLRGRNRALP